MFTQNMTLSAQIGSPLDHVHGLRVTVTVRPSSLHWGGSARLRSSSTPGPPSLPNQYSGRYISIWNSNRFRMPTRSGGVNGKMVEGGKPGLQAQVATPPFLGRSPSRSVRPGAVVADLCTVTSPVCRSTRTASRGGDEKSRRCSVGFGHANVDAPGQVHGAAHGVLERGTGRAEEAEDVVPVRRAPDEVARPGGDLEEEHP